MIEKASEVTQLMAKIATDLMAVSKDLAGQSDIMKERSILTSRPDVSIVPKIIVRAEDPP